MKFTKRSRNLFPGLIALLLSASLLIAASCSNGSGSTSLQPDITGDVTSSSFGGVLQLKMLDANVGWASTGGAVLKTSDGGKHWTDVTPSDWAETNDKGTPTSQNNGQSGKISAAFFLDANDAWIVSSNADEVGNSLAATAAASDGTATPTVNAAMKVFVRSTIDGGKTWMDAHPIDVTNLSQIYAPFFISQHEGWLALNTTSSDGQKNYGRVYRSTDGGITWRTAGPVGSLAGIITGQTGNDNAAGLTMTPNCITTLSTTQGVNTNCGQAEPPSPVQGCTTTGSTDTIGWLSFARKNGLLVDETTDSGTIWGPVSWPTPKGAPKQTNDSQIVASPPTIYGDGTGIIPIQMQSGPDADDPSNFYTQLYKMSYKSGVGASETPLGPTSPFASQIDAAYHIVSAPDVNHIFALGETLGGNATPTSGSNSTPGINTIPDNTHLYEFSGGNWQELTSTVNTSDKATPHPNLATLNNQSPLANLDFINDNDGWITGGNYLFHITISGNNATWNQVYPSGNTDTITIAPGQVISPPATPPPCASNTPTPVATTPGTQPNKLAPHTLVGYWQDFTNGSTNLRLGDVNPDYDIIAVAFANADPTKPGGVTFSIDSSLSGALGGYDIAQFTSDINKLHSQGKKVIISVGGQNGAISVNDATSATNFANSVFSLMTNYHFDGVDIDLENGINAASMASALKQLSSKAGPGLIITLAPQTVDMQSPSTSYFQLALNIKNILTLVNTQFYNSGTMNGCDGKVYAQGTVDFITAQVCLQLKGGLSAGQIGIGTPASSGAAGSGYVAPSVVNNALDCLENGANCGSFKPSTKYPAIGGVMTWSISWDAANNYNYARTIKGK